MQAYSQDLRDRALNALERGETALSVSQRLEVSVRWVKRVKHRLKEAGVRCSQRLGGYRRSRLEPYRQDIEGWIAQQPDMTLAEIIDKLTNEKAVTIGVTALWTQLNHWGLRFKKKYSRSRTTTSRCR